MDRGKRDRGSDIKGGFVQRGFDIGSGEEAAEARGERGLCHNSSPEITVGCGGEECRPCPCHRP